MCHVHECNKFPPNDINFGLFQLFHRRPPPRVHQPPKNTCKWAPATVSVSSRQHHRNRRPPPLQSTENSKWNVIQGRTGEYRTGKKKQRNNEYSVIIPCCIVPKQQQQQQHNGTYHPVTLITKPIPVHHPHKPFIYYFHSLGALPIIAFHISNAPSSAELIAILRLSVCRSVELSCGEAATLCRWGKSVNANNQPPWMLLLLLLLFLTDRLLAHN